MTEKFSRNLAVPADSDVAKRIYYLAEAKIQVGGQRQGGRCVWGGEVQVQGEGGAKKIEGSTRAGLRRLGARVWGKQR